MDVYVFVQAEPGRAADVMSGLVDSGAVTRAAVVTGDFDVVARIDAIEWDELAERVLGGVHRATGVVRTVTAVGLSPDYDALGINAIEIPIRLPPPPPPMHEAFVLARVTPASTSDVVGRVAQLDSVRALALLTGEQDLLIQVEGDSIERIADTVMSDLHAIAGIEATSTALILATTPPPAAAE